MSGFLARLVTRSIAGQPGLAPRPVYRFGRSEVTVSEPRPTQFGSPAPGAAGAPPLRPPRTELPDDHAISPAMENPPRGGRDEPESGRRPRAASDERLLPLQHTRVAPHRDPPEELAAADDRAASGHPPRPNHRVATDWAAHAPGHAPLAAHPHVNPPALVPAQRHDPQTSHHPVAAMASESTVVVHIGRIDVRAAVSAAAPARAQAGGKLTKPSLKAYLDARERGRP